MCAKEKNLSDVKNGNYETVDICETNLRLQYQCFEKHKHLPLIFVDQFPETESKVLSGLIFMTCAFGKRLLEPL